ncbi:MAG: hypothetical protein HKN32_06975, partial [Flavobacteriales bacterium]|nr:hypothetical protein [Flavobacteriales bacterium]
MDERPFFERVGSWFKTSVTVKLFVIGFLLLLLMIPVSMVNELINERQYRQREVEAEITRDWGNKQVVRGPLICVPTEHKTFIEDEETGEVSEYVNTNNAFFLPEELRINGTVVPRELNRDIFNVTVYETEIQLSGHFKPLHLDEWEDEHITPRWDKAQIVMGITDLSGVQDDINMNLAGKELSFNPGVSQNLPFQSGVSSPILLSEETGEIDFRTKLELQGSNGLEFAPLGKTT